MQAPLQKKDKSGVIICPRCHAQNFTHQTVCGRCGFVFSKGTEKGEKKEEKANSPFSSGSHSHDGAVQPPPLPGSQEAGGQSMGGEGEGSGAEETPPAPPKPQRPKHLPEKGATEGPIREMSGAPVCPHCGAELKEGLRRCPRCGFKIGRDEEKNRDKKEEHAN